MTAPTRNAWNWPDATRAAATGSPYLRPSDMLARFDFRPARRCGDCNAYVILPGSRGRCLSSCLTFAGRRADPARGHEWRGTWKACGAFQPRPSSTAPTPAAAPAPAAADQAPLPLGD